MKKWICVFTTILAVSLLLSGCVLKTMDELYCLPNRYQADNNLQPVIDEAMEGLEYCAPQSSDNRQVVQAADLDGDGMDEYLVLAKADSEKPLKILIFSQLASGYVLMDTIEGYGFGFDFVAYQQLDDRPGVEIIVGRLVGEEVVRSLSVYRFSSGIARHMLSAAYSRLTVSDPDADGISSLFLLNQSVSETANGTFSMYSFQDDQIHKVSELEISGPAYDYKQITQGRLQDGLMAMYVTCADDGGLTTDIFAVEAGQLHCVIRNVHSQMLGDHYVYPEDMDKDGVSEIPRLLPMLSVLDQQNNLIEWYTLDSQGNESVQRYTYHNYADNWYLQLDEATWDCLAAYQNENGCTFSIYDPEEDRMVPLYTIVTLMDADREELALQPGRVVLYRSDSAIYVADLTEFSEAYGISATELTNRFKTIRMDLKQED